MAFIDPVTYAENNGPQKEGARYILDQYLHMITWRDHPHVLDVGTRDGSFLIYDLLPRIPKCESVVGIDRNEQLIRAAEKHLQAKIDKNPKTQNRIKINFFQLDADTTPMPGQYIKRFDHIVSFYSLHWIQDQEKVFKNLFTMMKPGGSMLLALVVEDIPSKVHEMMKNIDQWKSFMEDYVKKYRYAYYDSIPTTVDRSVENHLAEYGFVKYEVRQECMEYTFENFEKFWGYCCAINPYISKIPPELQDMYKNDYINCAEQLNVSVTGAKTIRMGYLVAIVYGEKPKAATLEVEPLAAGAPEAGVSRDGQLGVGTPRGGAPEGGAPGGGIPGDGAPGGGSPGDGSPGNKKESRMEALEVRDDSQTGDEKSGCFLLNFGCKRK